MPKGDAAGELDTSSGWTEDLREAYADRIVERLGLHVENLASATIGRVALSPADIAAANPNWVGGDIYGGSCALDQNLLWRPLPQAPGHETAVDRLFHIGASTHPRSAWTSIGFGRQRTAPASSALRSSAGVSPPLTTTTCTSRVSFLFFSRRQTSSPSISGMKMSSTMKCAPARTNASAA